MLGTDHIDGDNAEHYLPREKMIARLYVAACDYMAVSSAPGDGRPHPDTDEAHHDTRVILLDLLSEVPDHLRPPEHREGADV